MSPTSILSAKLVTEQELKNAEDALTAPASARSLHVVSNRAIWAVMAQGRFTPEFGDGKVLRWGVFRIDVRTGSIVGSFGSGSSPPAQWWNRLSDDGESSGP